MATLAQRLGVTTMALYRHVADKADLLDGLVELLLAEVVQPASDLAWPERLAACANDLRATARRHPSVFPLLLSDLQPPPRPVEHATRSVSHSRTPASARDAPTTCGDC